MVRTTKQSDNVFSLAETNDFENSVKDVANHFNDIIEALQELAAAKQVFAEDRGIDEMQGVITAARRLVDEADLHIERVLKLQHARSYLDHGGKLVPTGGARPW